MQAHPAAAVCLAQPVVKGLMNKVLLHHDCALELRSRPHVRFLLVVGAAGLRRRARARLRSTGAGARGALSDGSMAVLLAKRALEASGPRGCRTSPRCATGCCSEGFLSEGEVQRFLTHAGRVRTQGKGKQEMEVGGCCARRSRCSFRCWRRRIVCEEQRRCRSRCCRCSTARCSPCGKTGDVAGRGLQRRFVGWRRKRGGWRGEHRSRLQQLSGCRGQR